jgi:hypothetical protein
MIPDSGKQTAAPAADDAAGKVRALPAVASRTAELALELRISALGLRFGEFCAAASQAVRTPFPLDLLSREIEIQRSRRRHQADERDLLLRCLAKLAELRGEQAAPSGGVA